MSVTIIGLENLQALLEQLPPNARYGAALGMNRTIDEAQAAIRDTLPAKFTLRRKAFIDRTIYRKPGEDFATKGHLEARVRIHDERNVLAKFELGGLKRPVSGRALAVPVDVKRTKTDIVSKANQVRDLLASGKAFIKNGRVWQVEGRGKKKRLRLAYVFKDAVPIPASLGFEATGRRVIVERAEANVSGAIKVELDRGLTARSGSQG